VIQKDRRKWERGKRGKQLVTRQGKRKRVEFNIEKDSGEPEDNSLIEEKRKGAMNGIAAQYIE